MKRLGILLVAFATLLGVWSAPAAAYDPSFQPAAGATFNVPQPWGTYDAHYRIVHKVNRAITNAMPGSTVLIATFFLDDNDSVNALINACQRGVRVRVILDGGVDNPAANRLVSVLNSDNVTDANNDGIPDTTPGPSCWQVPDSTTLPPAAAAASVNEPMDESAAWGADRSYVVKCKASCRGTRGNMHDKFFAFSQTGSATDVVMESSSNLNAGGAYRGWNDMYTVKGDPTMYDDFRKIHREMTNDQAIPSPYRSYSDGRYLMRFFPKPGATASSDPTMWDLNKIRCSSNFGATRVNVSMFYWANTRGLYLARKLISLGRAGCKVGVIYGALSRDVRLTLRAAAVKHQISMYDSKKQLDPDPDPEVRTHGKYLLVKGTFGGNRSAKMVITGSQNWVNYALLKADEMTLNINSGAAYDQYINNWNAVRKHSVRIPQR